MKIYIVTWGRVGRQVTWRSLPPSIQKQVTLLVDHSEANAHDDIPVTVLPKGLRGIGNVRQWAIDNAGEEKVVLLDDDLRFYVRRKDDPRLLQPATNKNIVSMFAAIDKALGKYAFVGVASREGANRETAKTLENVRLLRLLAYRADTLKREGIRFDRLRVMEDFDVALQLLRKGYPNLKLNTWCHNQGTSGDEGGCSNYRTLAVQAQAAKKLAKLHKDFVSVVRKETKTAWGGEERTDVMIHWKKAYDSAGAK